MASSTDSTPESVSTAITASGNPEKNPGGDPKEAQDDLKELGDKLDGLTEAERRQLAAELAGQQSTASQASGAAGQALRDAAQSLASGDTAAAREALDRLSEALEGANTNVNVNRDLSTAASRLQDARRDVATRSRCG